MAVAINLLLFALGVVFWIGVVMLALGGSSLCWLGCVVTSVAGTILTLVIASYAINREKENERRKTSNDDSD